MGVFRPQPRRRNHGFSLLELSVVLAIVSVVAVLGLESLAMFMNRVAYRTTQERLDAIKTALAKHRFTYGYLPCPAVYTYSYSNAMYGKEAARAGSTCGGSNLNATLKYGDVPVRDLGLPLSYIKDGYGTKFRYIMSPYLGMAGTAANKFYNAGTVGLIEVRTGKIEQPCSTVCQVMTTQAAYVVFSYGADRRTTTSVCTNNTAVDGMIDSVNCRFGTGTGVRFGGSGAIAAVPDNVFYDSRYNAGSVEQNHFDDLIIWQVKSQL